VSMYTGDRIKFLLYTFAESRELRISSCSPYPIHNLRSIGMLLILCIETMGRYRLFVLG
jgi:hypothetical protein